MARVTAYMLLMACACMVPLVSSVHHTLPWPEAETDSHECIHDWLMDTHDHWDVTVPQKYPTDNMALKDHYGKHDGPVVAPYDKKVVVLDDDLLLLELRSKTDAGAETEQQEDGSVMPLRIVANIEYLNEGRDVDRACFKTGDRYKIGDPPDDSKLCSDSPRDVDCWRTCEESDVLTQEKRNLLINDIIRRAVSWFESALRVVAVDGSLKLQAMDNCGFQGGVQIPAPYVQQGVAEADAVLFVTARPTVGSTIAWAGQCQHDQFSRAIAGQVNVGPGRIKFEKKELDYQVGVVIHEVTHALGFSQKKFAAFRDEHHNERPLDTVIKKIEKDYGEGRVHTVTKVITPRVQERSRDQFGCSTLDGTELEDGGGPGTALSHWEKRTLFNEYMTGTSSHNPVFSAITLGLMEDTGWYVSNYKAGEKLLWGFGMGCDFVMGDCDKWNGFGYHCTVKDEESCTYDRKAKGYCAMSRYQEELPIWYQRYEDPKVGGLSELADYCTFYVPYRNGDCRHVENRPHDTDVAEIRGEEYCTHCRCFRSSLVDVKVEYKKGYKSTCHRFQCMSPTLLEVRVRNTWVKCPPEGGEVQVAGFNGQIECPPAAIFCKDVNQCPNDCSGHGTCDDGKCRCHEMWMGEDCSTVDCPNDCNLRGRCVGGRCNCDPGWGGSSCELRTDPSNAQTQAQVAQSAAASAALAAAYPGLTVGRSDDPTHGAGNSVTSGNAGATSAGPVTASQQGAGVGAGANPEVTLPVIPQQMFPTPSMVAQPNSQLPPISPTASNLPPASNMAPPTASNLPPASNMAPPTASNLPPASNMAPPTASNLPPASNMAPPTPMAQPSFPASTVVGVNSDSGIGATTLMETDVYTRGDGYAGEGSYTSHNESSSDNEDECDDDVPAVAQSDNDRGMNRGMVPHRSNKQRVLMRDRWRKMQRQ